MKEVLNSPTGFIAVALVFSACTIRDYYQYLPDADPNAIDGSMDGSSWDAGADAPPAPQFADSYGGTEIDIGHTIAVSDGVVVGGQMVGPVDFGAGARSGISFLAKFTGTGQHVWSLGLPAQVRDIAIDSFGSVYAVGDFNVQISFGGPTLIPNGTDLFIVKYDGSTGAHLWSRGYGQAAIEEARRVAVMPSDDVLVCGKYQDTTNLGGGTLTHIGPTSTGDVFVARMHRTNGNHLWSSGFGGGMNDECSAVVATPAGEVLVFGGFSGGSFTFNGTTHTAPDSLFDMFVATFDASGSPDWSQRYGGTGTNLFHAAILAPQGDVLIAGEFVEDFTMGSVMLNNAASRDGLVARISPTNGNVVWATSVSGLQYDIAKSVAVLGDDVVVGGRADGTAMIGAVTIDFPGTFLARLGYADGIATLARSFSGQSSMTEMAAMDDNVVFTGGFQGTVDFGSGVGVVNNSDGQDDIFVARVRP